MTGVPITVVPSRIVKVSVPSLTRPAALVTVAVRGTVKPPTLKVAEALAEAVALAAALMIKIVTGIGEAEEVCRPVVHGLDDVGTRPVPAGNA